MRHQGPPTDKTGGVLAPTTRPVGSRWPRVGPVRITKIPPAFWGGAWGGVPHRKVPKKVPVGGTPLCALKKKALKIEGVPPRSGVGCRVFLGGTPFFYRCARSIENFCRIKMVVARASGMDLASILKRNTFLTLEVRPAGGPGSARDGGTEGAPGRGDRGGPGTGRTFVKWLIFLWGADVPLTKPHRVPPHGLYYTLYFWRGYPP